MTPLDTVSERLAWAALSDAAITLMAAEYQSHLGKFSLAAPRDAGELA